MIRLSAVIFPLICFCMSSVGYTQSKKELMIQLNDLISKREQEKAVADSLIASKEIRITTLENQIKSLKDTIDIKNKKIEQKQIELDSYMTATSRMGGRSRLKEPDLSQFRNVPSATIYLKLLVDENGTVVEAINDGKRSTTSDKIIVQQVIDLVKKELRYSREPGASLLQSNYAVKIGSKE
jgi:hypothetical protein